MLSDRQDEAIHAYAARHLGLVTRAQSLRLGFKPSKVRWRLDSGAWVTVGRGVYRVAGVPVTWEQRVLAACLLGGLSAVASHGSAGALWRIEGIRPGRPEITVRAAINGRAAARLARVHHSRLLIPSDVAKIGSIPVTTPVRTLADLADRLPEPALAQAVDDVLCRRLAKLGELTRQAALPQHGRPGAGRLARVLTAWAPEPLPSPGAEMRVLRCLVAHGLPRPQLQHEIWADGRLVGRLDMAWPAARVGLEVDSWRWHGGSPGRFHRTSARALRVRALGWDMLSVTPRSLEDEGGDALCAAVRAALDRARSGSSAG